MMRKRFIKALVQDGCTKSFAKRIARFVRKYKGDFAGAYKNRNIVLFLYADRELDRRHGIVWTREFTEQKVKVACSNLTYREMMEIEWK